MISKVSPWFSRWLDPFINQNYCYNHAGALRMTALILWVPARILLLCTRGFVQQYSSSTLNVNVFSCVHNVLMNKLAGKMCFQMQYLRGGSLKFTAFQCCHPQSPRADVTFWIVKLPWIIRIYALIKLAEEKNSGAFHQIKHLTMRKRWLKSWI